jgi:hypothetical protein
MSFKRFIGFSIALVRRAETRWSVSLGGATGRYYHSLGLLCMVWVSLVGFSCLSRNEAFATRGTRWGLYIVMGWTVLYNSFSTEHGRV